MEEENEEIGQGFSLDCHLSALDALDHESNNMDYILISFIGDQMHCATNSEDIDYNISVLDDFRDCLQLFSDSDVEEDDEEY